MKCVQIEDCGAVVGLVRNPVVLPPKPEIQSQSWCDLPLILKIGHVESAPQLVTAPRIGVGDSVERSIYKTRIGCTAVIFERKSVACGQTLIQPNAANLDPSLECVTSMNPSQIVDNTVCRADFVIRLGVVDRGPVISLDGIG